MSHSHPPRMAVKLPTDFTELCSHTLGVQPETKSLNLKHDKVPISQITVTTENAAPHSVRGFTEQAVGCFMVSS